MQSSERARTPRRSAVFPQKALKICPALTFVPGEPQCSAPTAFGLAVGLRAGVDDDAERIRMSWRVSRLNNFAMRRAKSSVALVRLRSA